VKTLPVSTKFAYGVGQVAEGIKSRAFDYIVFFYFTQVLGLSGSLAGLAVAIALVFDALTDPVAGHLSDNWKSRLGRRHPFMYAAALPLSLSWYMLFFPPSGLGQLGLFAWFLTFAILVRSSMTLYHVPHMAMGAELSDDYEERTSIVQWRTLCSMVGSLGSVGVGIAIFFPETAEFGSGLMNPAGYPSFAAASALVMLVTVWYSAWGTRQQIPRLPGPPDDPKPFSVRDTFQEFGVAWRNPSFRALFLGFSLFAITISIGTTLGTHLNVFFWGFSTDQIATLIVPTAAGFVVGVMACGILHRRFDKKPSLIASCVISGVLGHAAVVMRMADVLPPNGDVRIFELIFALLLAAGFTAGIAYTSAGSMMADVAQDQYVRTGNNQQGILFSAVSFSGKLGSAGGHLMAGVGVDLIAFPLQTDPLDVAPALIARLGAMSLVAAPVAAAGIWAYTRYRITRASYAASIRGLAESGPAA
jgi:Na+/melibiose symporter-like transporter